MGNTGEFICQNCQGKLLRMVPKMNFTPEEIAQEIEEAKKGHKMNRFKIIDEKLYRDEWESGLMIWAHTKNEVTWDKKKVATWFCKCGNYSKNYKDFLIRNSKKASDKTEGNKITLTEEELNKYKNDLIEANKKSQEKDKKIEDLEEEIKNLKAKLLEKNEDENKV